MAEKITNTPVVNSTSDTGALLEAPPVAVEGQSDTSTTQATDSEPVAVDQMPKGTPASRAGQESSPAKLDDGKTTRGATVNLRGQGSRAAARSKSGSRPTTFQNAPAPTTAAELRSHAQALLRFGTTVGQVDGTDPAWLQARIEQLSSGESTLNSQQADGLHRALSRGQERVDPLLVQAEHAFSGAATPAQLEKLLTAQWPELGPMARRELLAEVEARYQSQLSATLAGLEEVIAVNGPHAEELRASNVLDSLLAELEASTQRLANQVEALQRDGRILAALDLHAATRAMDEMGQLRFVVAGRERDLASLMAADEVHLLTEEQRAELEAATDRLSAARQALVEKLDHATQLLSNPGAQLGSPRQLRELAWAATLASWRQGTNNQDPATIEARAIWHDSPDGQLGVISEIARLHGILVPRLSPPDPTMLPPVGMSLLAEVTRHEHQARRPLADQATRERLWPVLAPYIAEELVVIDMHTFEASNDFQVRDANDPELARAVDALAAQVDLGAELGPMMLGEKMALLAQQLQTRDLLNSFLVKTGSGVRIHQVDKASFDQAADSLADKLGLASDDPLLTGVPPEERVQRILATAQHQEIGDYCEAMGMKRPDTDDPVAVAAAVRALGARLNIDEATLTNASIAVMVPTVMLEVVGRYQTAGSLAMAVAQRAFGLDVPLDNTGSARGAAKNLALLRQLLGLPASTPRGSLTPEELSELNDLAHGKLEKPGTDLAQRAYDALLESQQITTETVRELSSRALTPFHRVIEQLNDLPQPPTPESLAENRLLAQLVDRDANGHPIPSQLHHALSVPYWDIYQDFSKEEYQAGLIAMVAGFPGGIVPRPTFRADMVRSVLQLRHHLAKDTEDFVAVRTAIRGPAHAPFSLDERVVLAALFFAMGKDAEEPGLAAQVAASFDNSYFSDKSAIQRGELLAKLAHCLPEEWADHLSTARLPSGRTLDLRKHPLAGSAKAQVVLRENVDRLAMSYGLEPLTEGGETLAATFDRTLPSSAAGSDKDLIDAISDWNAAGRDPLNRYRLTFAQLQKLIDGGLYQPDPKSQQALIDGTAAYEGARQALLQTMAALRGQPMDYPKVQQCFATFAAHHGALLVAQDRSQAIGNQLLDKRIQDAETTVMAARLARDGLLVTGVVLATAGIAAPAVTAGTFSWLVAAKAVGAGVAVGATYSVVSRTGEELMRGAMGQEMDAMRAAQGIGSDMLTTVTTAGMSMLPMGAMGKMASLARHGNKLARFMIGTTGGRMITAGGINVTMDYLGYQSARLRAPKAQALPDYQASRALFMFGFGAATGPVNFKLGTQSATWARAADASVDISAAAVENGVANLFEGREFFDGLASNGIVVATLLANRWAMRATTNTAASTQATEAYQSKYHRAVAVAQELEGVRRQRETARVSGDNTAVQSLGARLEDLTSQSSTLRNDLVRLGLQAFDESEVATVDLRPEPVVAGADSTVRFARPADLEVAGATPVTRDKLPIGSQVELIGDATIKWFRPGDVQVRYHKTIGTVVAYHDNGTPVIVTLDPSRIGKSMEPYWQAKEGPIDYIMTPGADGQPVRLMKSKTARSFSRLDAELDHTRKTIPLSSKKSWELFEYQGKDGEPPLLFMPPRKYDHNDAFASRRPTFARPENIILDANGTVAHDLRDVAIFSAHGWPFGYGGISTRKAAETVASVVVQKNARLPPNQQIRYLYLDSCMQGNPRAFNLIGDTNAQAFQRHLNRALREAGVDPSGPGGITVLASDRPGYLYGTKVKHKGEYVETQFVPASQQLPVRHFDAKDWGITVGEISLTMALVTEMGVVVAALVDD